MQIMEEGGEISPNQGQLLTADKVESKVRFPSPLSDEWKKLMHKKALDAVVNADEVPEGVEVLESGARVHIVEVRRYVDPETGESKTRTKNRRAYVINETGVTYIEKIIGEKDHGRNVYLTTGFPTKLFAPEMGDDGFWVESQGLRISIEAG